MAGGWAGGDVQSEGWRGTEINNGPMVRIWDRSDVGGDSGLKKKKDFWNESPTICGAGGVKGNKIVYSDDRGDGLGGLRGLRGYILW